MPARFCSIYLVMVTAIHPVSWIITLSILYVWRTNIKEGEKKMTIIACMKFSLLQ